jgi:DNA polymerase III epsilon subunit-like protein
MNIAVFDLETNGLQGSSVLSASSIVFDDEGVVRDVFNRFYLPLEPFNNYVTRIHGLTFGRLRALREHIEAPSHFIEDWPDLLDFWDALNVEGVVVHNLTFDTSFLPEAAQRAFLWWCSMRGLVNYCAIPKRGVSEVFKWPKLEEARDIVCDGPNALAPSKATEDAENTMTDGVSHVSLFDCFELYRVVSRIVKHHRHLLQFAPFVTPFRPPKIHKGRAGAYYERTGTEPDRFVTNLLAYERKLRSVARSESVSRVTRT